MKSGSRDAVEVIFKLAGVQFIGKQVESNNKKHAALHFCSYHLSHAKHAGDAPFTM